MRESLTRQGRGKRKKNHIQNYSNHTYMHGYYSNFAYMQNFTSTNAGLFDTISCKYLHILYFAPTCVDALREQNIKSHTHTQRHQYSITRFTNMIIIIIIKIKIKKKLFLGT